MFSFITCPLALGFDNTALKNTTFLLRLLLTPPFTATPGRAEREVPMLRALGKSDAMHSPQPAQSLSLSSKYTVTFQWARATRSITFADYVWSSPVPGPFLEQSHVSQLTPGDSLAVRGARTDHSLQVTVSKTTSQSSFITIRYGKGNLFLLILLLERGGQLRRAWIQPYVYSQKQGDIRKKLMYPHCIKQRRLSASFILVSYFLSYYIISYIA